MREYSERLGQLLLSKILRHPTYFDGLRHRNTKVFRLFNKPARRHFVRFGRVNEIKTKQVFLRTHTHMKAVAVIRRIRNEPAIFQHNPIFWVISCAKIDSRAPKNNNRNESAYAESRENRRGKNQTATLP